MPGDETPWRRSAMMLRSFALEKEVQRLLRASQHELAVLLAQTLLELRTEAELAHFVEQSQEQAMGEAALALLPSYNLANPRTQTFFEGLVGVRFRDHCPEQFAALKAHVTRRNGIAHRGEQVSAEDARASVQAVLAMTQIAHELCYRALGMEDDLEEEKEEEERQRQEWEGEHEDELE